jgi:cytochrome c peroxidase
MIEAAVFPQPAPDFHGVARREVEGMRRILDVIRAEPAETLEADRRALDAARLEVARIATLGLAEFDALLSGDALPESAEALRGVGDGLEMYRAAMERRDSAGWVELDRTLQAAIAELERPRDPNEFDRLGFLVRFVNPLTGALGRLQRSLALPPTRYPGAWAPGAMSLYQVGAIDPRWFAPDYAAPPGPKVIALGRDLFANPALSVHRRRACATCHQPARAFTDGLARAAVDSGHAAARNTPTLLNAGLQAFQFADQRARYLEFQVEEVMRNPVEMGLPVDSAAQRLGEDSAMVERFADALGTPRPAALTGRMVAVVIAAYLRSLVALDSRFDRAVRGDTAALTPSEARGFNLFLGKARCGTCHFPPLFGGTVPPGYRESEVEVIGVPARAARRGAVVDPDPGVFAVDRLPLHRHAFKTPGLRNVAVTAPYMHNGVFRTLDEVIDFYDRGGGNGLGMRLPNQTLLAEPLRLTDGEKQDLVAFLDALTDTAVVALAGEPSPR